MISAQLPLWTLLQSREEYGGGDLPLLAVKSESGVELRDMSQGRQPSDDMSGYRVVRPGDLVVNRLWARFGAYGVSPEAGIISPAYWVFLIDQSRLYPRYLHYLLRSELYRHEVARRSKNMPPNGFELPWEQFRQIRVPIIAIEEQRRIAEFLDAETVRIHRMQLATNRQASLLSEHFNESVRLATTIGSGPTAQTGIVWMPEMNESWRLVKVSHAFRTGSGTTPTSDRVEYFNGPFPWVNSSDIKNGEILASEKSVTARALSDFSALKIHPAGSLVIALYGQGVTKGNVGILRNEACLNQACCALIPTGSITAEYASYWFRAHKDGIVGLALGAGQPNLSQELVRQLKIPAPELSEQRRITDKLRRMEEGVEGRTNLLRSRERLLAERRQALITAAVTGQIDVSTASGRGVDVG